MDGVNKQIGEILLEKGLITQEQLEGALQEQKLTKEFLGAILVKRRALNEDDFLNALSEQFGFPYVEVDRAEVNLNVALQFSPTFIIDHQCFPLKESEFSVTVAIINPLDVYSFSGIEREAKMRNVSYVLVSTTDMQWLKQKYQEYRKIHFKDLFNNEDTQ